MTQIRLTVKDVKQTVLEHRMAIHVPPQLDKDQIAHQFAGMGRSFQMKHVMTETIQMV